MAIEFILQNVLNAWLTGWRITAFQPLTLPPPEKIIPLSQFSVYPVLHHQFKVFHCSANPQCAASEFPLLGCYNHVASYDQTTNHSCTRLSGQLWDGMKSQLRDKGGKVGVQLGGTQLYIIAENIAFQVVRVYAYCRAAPKLLAHVQMYEHEFIFLQC